jgi:uncharacterized membrane protein
MPPRLPALMGDRLSFRPAMILLITLAGFALRLYRLGADSLWYDETVSTALAGSPLPELIRHTAGDIHPPGYYVLLRGWLALAGYPTGRADPTGNGLEFMAGFFSLLWGVILIALVYALARRLTTNPVVALLAAALIALSPYNVWYSQEVRMYTLGAALGALALYALWRAVGGEVARPSGPHPLPPLPRGGMGEGSSGMASVSRWWIVYAVAAAAGMYTLYYFAFLLIPLSLWALVVMLRGRQSIWSWLLAHAGAVLLYAPWVPVAWRQATEPPVPPWRTAPDLWIALRESWTALSLGQSAPGWLWPVLLLTLALYALGLWRLRSRAALVLALATFGPLALILVISFAATPLYHVRYLFTYSPAFYVLLAAALAGLGQRMPRRGATDKRMDVRRAPHASVYPFIGAAASVALWLVAAGVTLNAFWFDPAYRADDHRTAVRQLQAAWRPSDAVLVNAGWSYTALAAYWDGPVLRSRLTEPLPEPGTDPATLVMVTTGHVDGDARLGWADPRSDFYALPAAQARAQVAALFATYPRVWHYRLYDTVNDPTGVLRGLLAETGYLAQDEVYPGEAYLRVEQYVPRAGVTWPDDAAGAVYGDALEARWEMLPPSIATSETLYTAIRWRPGAALTGTLATSLRLVGPDGHVWAQPPDERPLGPAFLSPQWPAGIVQRQPLALAVPEGLAPGTYTVLLVAYDAATGQPLSFTPLNGTTVMPPGVVLGHFKVHPPASSPPRRPAVAEFGPVALIAATTPATTIAPGGAIPVELLWQVREAPPELVTVVQLLGPEGELAANLETPMLCGQSDVLTCAPGQLNLEHHTLTLPPDLQPGPRRLIVGVYTRADGRRLMTGGADHYEVREILIQ